MERTYPSKLDIDHDDVSVKFGVGWQGMSGGGDDAICEAGVARATEARYGDR